VATASLRLGHRGLALRWLESPEWAARDVPLPEQFDYSAWHTFRVDVDGPYVRLAFDGGAVVLEGALAAAAREVHLLSEAVPCEFAGFWLSRGWTNDFARGGSDPAAHGWRSRDGAWRVEDFELRATAPDAGPAVKAAPCRDYELVVNARVLDGDGTWVVAPAVTEDLRGPRVMLEHAGREAALLVESGDETTRLALVGAPDPREHLQLRFVRRDAALRVALGDRDLCEIAVAPDASFVGLATRGGRAGYDHVRLSELPATEVTD
jgi:hypothetical protein